MTAKILAIEDSRQMNNLIKAVLTKHGFEVMQSFSGQEGINEWRKDKYDLVLLDIKLPDMNGFDVLERLKKLQEEGTQAVVFLSGINDQNTINRINSSGALGFISKPFAPDKLIIMLKEYVPFIFELAEEQVIDNIEQDYLESLQNEYIDEWLASLPDMENAIKNGEVEKASLMAHKLAGSGGTMELPFITDAGRKLMELISENQFDNAVSLIRSIHSFLQTKAKK